MVSLRVLCSLLSNVCPLHYKPLTQTSKDQMIKETKKKKDELATVGQLMRAVVIIEQVGCAGAIVGIFPKHENGACLFYTGLR